MLYDINIMTGTLKGSQRKKWCCAFVAEQQTSRILRRRTAERRCSELPA